MERHFAFCEVWTGLLQVSCTDLRLQIVNTIFEVKTLSDLKRDFKENTFASEYISPSVKFNAPLARPLVLSRHSESEK